jgi:beta-N-acetylhexosaminidase
MPVAVLFIFACLGLTGCQIQATVDPMNPVPTRSPMLTYMSQQQKIGQLLMVGFKGTQPTDKDVQALKALISEGKVGGIIFFAYNIESPDQVRTLTHFFREKTLARPLLVALDQEGGKVQRLHPKKGFPHFLSHKAMAQQPVEFARVHYQHLAKTVKEAGFNMVLGPVVDLDHPTSPSPVIGQLERSFGTTPDIVVAYARAFIEACHQQGLLTSLKHFPGHGYAQSDSHKGMVDVTKTHHPQELEPFYRLMDAHQVDTLMTAHLVNQIWDPLHPVTLSSTTLKTLLTDKGYAPVVISDCLNMGAIAQHYTLEQTVIQALKAGVHILLFSNNEAAQGVNANKGQQPSTQAMVEKLHTIIKDALADGRLTPDDLDTAVSQVLSLKSKVKR